MISPSLPEPLCDVLAQLRALTDPAHPKDCVWLAMGTAFPKDWTATHAHARADGMLLSADDAKIRYFERHPTDETLADLLGYVEPKWRISGYPVVARAVDGNGCVITEMVCSGSRVGEAVGRLRHHGRIELRAIGEVLARRVRLCEMEAR